MLPSRWALWGIPSAVLAYLLTVDGLAAAVVAATSYLFPITSTDLVRLLILAVGSAIHIEAGRGIERLRHVAAEGVPYTTLKGMWTFAAALLLPPPLAALLIAVTYTYSWFRLRRIPTHQVVFNAATVILSSAAAAVVLVAVSPVGYPGYPSGWLGLVALAAAGLAYWFINLTLILIVMMLSNPSATAGRMLGPAADHLIVAGSLGLGAAMAIVLMHEPWAVVVLLLSVLGLHQAMLVGHFQTAARTDGKTGLANFVFWHEMASKELQRAQRTKKPLSVLYLDLDHFKGVNDTVGHPAGDEVLKAVAKAIEQEVRADDLVGRIGGDEFTVLLPETDAADVVYAAERIRRRVTSLGVTVQGDDGPTMIDDLSCSIGAATYPDAGQTIDQLLLAADTALYAAKAAGKNVIRSAPAVADPAVPEADSEQPDGPAPS